MKYKPKTLWTGLDRARLRKLSNALRMMRARDDRAATAAAESGDPGFYFGGPDQAAVKAAMTTLENRIATCLTQTTTVTVTTN